VALGEDVLALAKFQDRFSAADLGEKSLRIKRIAGVRAHDASLLPIGVVYRTRRSTARCGDELSFVGLVSTPTDGSRLDDQMLRSGPPRASALLRIDFAALSIARIVSFPRSIRINSKSVRDTF